MQFLIQKLYIHKHYSIIVINVVTLHFCKSLHVCIRKKKYFYMVQVVSIKEKNYSNFIILSILPLDLQY